MRKSANKRKCAIVSWEYCFDDNIIECLWFCIATECDVFAITYNHTYSYSIDRYLDIQIYSAFDIVELCRHINCFMWKVVRFM